MKMNYPKQFYESHFNGVILGVAFADSLVKCGRTDLIARVLEEAEFGDVFAWVIETMLSATESSLGGLHEVVLTKTAFDAAVEEFAHKHPRRSDT